MPVPESDRLTIYVLNVGEGDTSVIRTPAGSIVLIDAVAPDKLVRLLQELGLQDGEEIEELVITHPHRDHFGAASSLISRYGARSVTLAPFWHRKGWGPKSYQTLVNRIEQGDMPVHFVSGYSRAYLDDLIEDADGGTPLVKGDVPYLELLGPPNSLVRSIEPKTGYGENHLSVMTKLVWGKFSMVFAADAQMENWAAFDSEGMLADQCDVLKAAHHGSKNGTQWERLHRLAPSFVVVSSDPDGRHRIPDLCGCAALKEYEDHGHIVVLTYCTGTIEISVEPSGRYETFSFRDSKDGTVEGSMRTPLTKDSNPTDWGLLLGGRL